MLCLLLQGYGREGQLRVNVPMRGVGHSWMLPKDSGFSQRKWVCCGVGLHTWVQVAACITVTDRIQRGLAMRVGRCSLQSLGLQRASDESWLTPEFFRDT